MGNGKLANFILEGLPAHFETLAFEGNVNPDSRKYKRVLHLLQSGRKWKRIGLSDDGVASASPAFLSLVVSALTKTDHVTLSNCPFDQNFFACLNYGMHTLAIVCMADVNIPVFLRCSGRFCARAGTINVIGMARDRDSMFLRI
ncbi:unnamed protein product [Cylindrotheca closterium]|uniref:Uncharacterized protein n=1 Tax=Cylindrotheca closterium TaxID=2856 RepID=A0AAD2G643_9STRA|nr:unnamed protein product [Cylindrotheca closterium]